VCWECVARVCSYDLSSALPQCSCSPSVLRMRVAASALGSQAGCCMELCASIVTQNQHQYAVGMAWRCGDMAAPLVMPGIAAMVPGCRWPAPTFALLTDLQAYCAPVLLQVTRYVTAKAPSPRALFSKV
jgi:hypothetical protein